MIAYTDAERTQVADTATQPPPKPTRARPNWSLVSKAETELAEAQALVKQQAGVIEELGDSLAYARQETDAVRRGYKRWQLPLIGFGALLYALGEAAVRAVVQ
jgi:hypothetical protein